MQQIKQLHQQKILPGILLLTATCIALSLSNSNLAPFYYKSLHSHLYFNIGTIAIDVTLHHVINDLLMVIFFFCIGLELKHELTCGSLSNYHKSIFPCIGALGGMLAPALIYTSFNYSNPIALKGWAIPLATDIAFALGALACFGKRIPHNLSIVLMAIAVFDDLMAILIIAFFYSKHIALAHLAGAVVTGVLLVILNRSQNNMIWLYTALDIPLWYFLLMGGVHPTLAGVITAISIPITREKGKDISKDNPVEHLKHRIEPYVNYIILPLFALANAGVNIQNVQTAVLLSPVVYGISLGLCLGKPLGITLLSMLSTWCGICKLPQGCNWKQFFGMSMLCGIGFTMSLFIGELAFDPQLVIYNTWVKVGVLTGSLISIIAGVSTLLLFTKMPDTQSRQIR